MAHKNTRVSLPRPAYRGRRRAVGVGESAIDKVGGEAMASSARLYVVYRWLLSLKRWLGCASFQASKRSRQDFISLCWFTNSNKSTVLLFKERGVPPRIWCWAWRYCSRISSGGSQLSTSRVMVVRLST